MHKLDGEFIRVKFDAEPEYIEWTDSSGENGWVTDDNSLSGCMECKAIGWVRDETDTHVSISGHMGTFPIQRYGVITIPKVAITRRSKVRIDESEKVDDGSEDPC